MRTCALTLVKPKPKARAVKAARAPGWRRAKAGWSSRVRRPSASKLAKASQAVMPPTPSRSSAFWRSNDSKAAEAGQPGQKAPDATVKEAAARREMAMKSKATWCQELSLSLGVEEAFLSQVFDT